MKHRLRQLSIFFVKYECIIVAIVSIVIVGLASFSFGMLKGAQLNKSPLHIQTAQEKIMLCNDECVALHISDDASKENNSQRNQERCPFVGSVNGKKYYPPRCSAVKRITPTNLTCFSSKEDAEGQGYTQTTSCVY